MWSMWSNEPPPDDDPHCGADDEQRYLLDCEQDEYERAAAECDERAPWPGDPKRPFTESAESRLVREGYAQLERAGRIVAKVGGAR